MRKIDSLKTILLLALCCVFATSCSSAVQDRPAVSDSATLNNSNGPSLSPTGGTAEVDDSQVMAAQESRGINVSVTCTLPVKKMLRPDNKGERHEKFLLQASNGTTILVAHNVSRAPAVPISAGDVVTVHGGYIWNKKGGLIHWTHKSDSPRHPGGYIDFQGQRYQ
jgi:hypothetical protein